MKNLIITHKYKMSILLLLIGIGQLFVVVGSLLSADMVNALVKNNVNLFFYKTMIIMIVWITVAVISYVKDIFSEHVIQSMNCTLRSEITRKLTNLNYLQYNENSVGKYVSWLNNDIKSIDEQGLQSLFIVIEGIFGTSFALVALCRYHWSLAVLSLFMTVLIISIPKLFSKRLENANQRQSDENENFVSVTEDSLSVFNELFALRSLTQIVDKIMSASDKLGVVNVKRVREQTNVSISGFLLNVIAQILLMGLSGYLALNGQVAIGVIVAVGSLSGNVFNNLGNMSTYIGMIRGVKPFFNKGIDNEKNNILPVANLEFQDKLTVEHVYFGYNANLLFKDVSINFAKDNKYLIIGKSGGGKSTFLKIIAGYIEPLNGSVHLDGIDYEKINGQDIRENIFYLDQNSAMFSGTVRDNLTLKYSYSEADLIDMLIYVELASNAEEAKKLLDVTLTSKSKNISGGQIQRLALARGLLRKPKIILVDEGTSAIDPQTAILIETKLLGDHDLTVIMVSHTYHEETKNKFDHIIDFDKFN